jgi:uncharacterized tellurite resistance protein B-like protein
MNLWTLLGIKEKDTKKQQDLGSLFDEIQRLLKNHPEDRIKLITGFAGLLGKVAYADMEISKEEVDQIRQILVVKMHLRESVANAVIDMIEQHRIQLLSIEDYIYIRLINSVTDKDQKLDLLNTLFMVAAADDSISAEEDSAIRIVAKGLLLSHRDFIEARSPFKKHLDWLKKD